MKNRNIDYILLSPSKEMRQIEVLEKTCEESSSYAKQGKELSPKSKEILSILKSYDLQDLQELYGMSREKILLEKERIEKLGEEPAVPAYILYDGAAFKELKKEVFTKSQEDFLHKHLVILSAFYGPLFGMDGIWPYRLDLMMKFKVRGKSLRSLWKKEMEDFFNGKCILNLASQEFSSILPKDKMRIIHVDFMPGEKISTYEKKQLRGSLAGFILRSESLKLKDLEYFREGIRVYHEKDRIIVQRDA